MSRYKHLFLFGIAILFLIGGRPELSIAQTSSSASDESTPDSVAEKEAPYVPTPQHIVLHMLKLADVNHDDVVYDLGSGDGRIVITAAKEFGARGVGIEIDPDLVKRARTNAERAGVEDRVEFRQADLFDVPLGDATVVTMYLWPTMNERLRPKLRRELSRGSRVLSHDFDIDGWEPDTTVSIGENTLQESANQIHFWTIDGGAPK